MPYKRMFCWVRPHEKKALIEAVNKRFPLAFAKNMEDFRNNITEGDYLIFSLSKAKFGYKKVLEFVQSFPNFRFNLYEALSHDGVYATEFYLMHEDNVTEGQYGAQELVDNYLGIIPDLWEMRSQGEAIIYFDEDPVKNKEMSEAFFLNCTKISVENVVYKRMLCWVRPHEKKALIEAVDNRFPVAFAKNIEDFRNSITENDYLVFSQTKANFCYKKVLELVRSFPNFRFNIYAVPFIRGQKTKMYRKGSYIDIERNVTDGSYEAQELVDNYLGIIPDLWEERVKPKK
jgi:hypothetical protein